MGKGGMLIRYSFITLLMSALFGTALSAEVNPALRKSYTISPKPNYPSCTDKLDTIQLTDGQKSGSDWRKKSTVGWRRMNSPPEITIDLEKLTIFDEVRVYTLGGGYSGIEYPRFIIVLASKDGSKYEFTGLVMDDNSTARSLLARGERPRTFLIKHPRTEARFVKILLQPGGLKFCLDEIEVIRASVRSDRQMTKYSGDIFVAANATEAVELVEEQLQLAANIASTIEFSKSHAPKMQASMVNSNLKRLQYLSGELSVGAGLLNRSKLTSIRRELGVIRAGTYQQLYKKPYVCLPANPMMILQEKKMLSPADTAESEIRLRLWQGEYEYGAVNIINCSDKDLMVGAEVSQLAGPGNATIDSQKIITLRRSVFVHAKDLGMIADPFVLHNSTKPFRLEPGAVAQFWVTVFSPALKAGQYKAALAFLAKDSNGRQMPIQTVQLNMKVEPIKLNPDAALNTYCWAHPRRLPMTRMILPEVARDLREHYIDIFVVHGGSLPYPKFVSPSGIITEKPSYGKFDELLRINSYARMYLLHLGFNSEVEGNGRFGRWMTNAWKKAFSTWLVDFVTHLKQKGVDYSRFAIQPFDETLNDNFFELSKLIKNVDHRINIFANSYGKGQMQISRLKDLVDIWCLPERQTKVHKAKFMIIKSFDKQMWVYDAKGPGKANHPYGYYRLMPWRAFKRGQTGAGFWAYSEVRNEIRWDDTLKPFGYYAVIYGAGNSPVDTLGEPIVPSRRWEAWREGVEDYQYLYELRKAIESNKTTDPAKAAKTQQILDSQVNYVLSAPDDCNRVYQAREKLTEALLQLKGPSN